MHLEDPSTGLPDAIMSYNLLEGCRVDPRNKIPGDPGDRLLEFAKTQSNTLWCLQEVNDWYTKSICYKFLKATQSTSYGYGDSDSRPGKTSVYDVATFAPPRCCASMRVVEKGLKHSAVITTLKYGSDILTVVNLHLSPGSEDERLQEIDFLLAECNTYDQLMVVGDFNSLSRRDGYNETDLLAGLQERGIKKFGTTKLRYDVTDLLESNGLIDVGAYFCDFTPTVPSPFNYDEAHQLPLRVDYAFASRKARNLITGYNVIVDGLTDTISDHYPLRLPLR